MDLEKKFKEAASSVNTLRETSDDEKLTLYGYYKQATIGNINKEKPYFWDRVGLAKWTAWEKCKDMTKEDAKKNYIEFVKMLKN